jgi:hypothetical protein
MTEESLFNFRQMQEIFLFSKASRRDLLSTQSTIKCEGDLFTGGKTAGA